MYVPTSRNPSRTLRFETASPNGAGFAHFLIQRKNIIGLKQIDAVWVFECSSSSRAPCMFFTVEDLAQAVPRPPDPPAQPNPTPGPSDEDPNARENTNKPGSEPGPSQMVKRRGLEKRNFVRVHTFRYNGNMTVASEYM